MKRRRLLEIIGATLMISLMTFSGLSCTKDGPAKLEGVTWVLKSYGDANSLVDALLDKEVTLTFDKEEGRLGGNGGVNAYGGSYTIDGDRLRVSDLVSTKIAGPPALQNQENVFFDILKSALRFSIDDNELTITGTAGVLVLEKK